MSLRCKDNSQNTHKNGLNFWKKSFPGFSLVELLLVIVISMIVTGVAFSLYRLNASYYFKEDAYLQQYQNLRVALYTVGRDIRMAGNGFSLLGPNLKLIQAFTPSREIPSNNSPPSQIAASPGFFHHSDSLTGKSGVRAIYGVDGGANSPDTVTVFRAEMESSTPLGVVTNYSMGKSSVTPSAPIPENLLNTGDIIAIGNDETCYIVEVGNLAPSGGVIKSIPIQEGGRYTKPSSPVIPNVDLNGFYIYNFRDVTIVTYYVDTANNLLMANYHDIGRKFYDDKDKKTTVVAANIEDLQLYYFFDNDAVDNSLVDSTPDISSVRLNNQKVKAVTIGLVSRSHYGSGAARYTRPKFFNRAAGTKKDNKSRSVLVETVYLRNFNI